MKTNKYQLLILAISMAFTACNRNKFEHDASGTFEATEIIVSSEVSGKIESFNITEGDVLTQNQYVGYIDSTQLFLKKLQLQTVMKSVNVRRPDLAVQISATKEQIRKAETEKNRVENLFKDNAATQKQVDDAVNQLNVLKRNLDAQISSLSNTISGMNEESASYEIQIAQVEDQLSKCRIINPINGTVLNKYVEEKEVVSPGKPMYKIADTKHIFLRVYVVSTQLESIKIGQEATVSANFDKGEKQYKGKVSWISDKAEFTPKTIQTKDERQNLVYAVKIAVENTDGLLKIGMYGDVNF